MNTFRARVRRVITGSIAALTVATLVVTGAGVASAAEGPDQSSVPRTTTVVGWRTADKAVAGSAAPRNEITITPALGRSVELQQEVSSTWTTRSTLTTAAGDSAKLTVTLTKHWDDARTTKWRLVVPSTATAKQVVSATKVVSVKQRATKVSGWDTSVNKTAGTTLTDTVAITSGAKRKVRVQQYVSGKWVTRKVVTTSGTTAKPKIVLPKQWYSQYTTKWRLAVDETTFNQGAVTKTKTVHVRAKDAPAARYLQPVTKVHAIKGGGFNLTRGMNGVKVKQVRAKLGLSTYHRANTVDAAMTSRVASFQRSHGLRATGVVNKATWVEMGFSASSWTSIDTYTVPVRATLASSRSQRIEIFIGEAMKNVGTRYVWGGTGKPGWNDCSGMVLQALYAAGIDPGERITPVKHALPSFRSTYAMKSHPHLKKVPWSAMKRGDILYGGFGGNSHHVAIYLGGRRMVEMAPGGGRVSSVSAFSAPFNRVAIRPFG